MSTSEHNSVGQGKRTDQGGEPRKDAVLFIGLLVLLAATIQASLLANTMWEISELSSSQKEQYQLIWDIPNRLTALCITMFSAAFVFLYDRVAQAKALMFFLAASIGSSAFVLLSEDRLQQQAHHALAQQAMSLCETSHHGKGKYRKKVFHYAAMCPVR